MRDRGELCGYYLYHYIDRMQGIVGGKCIQLNKSTRINVDMLY